MTITIQGILYGKSNPVKVGKEGKEKIEFVVKETTDKYPNTFKVETFNMETLDKAILGDLVEIEVDVKGRGYEKNGKLMYFVSLVSWKEITIIEKSNNRQENPVAANNLPNLNTNIEPDLPF